MKKWYDDVNIGYKDLPENMCSGDWVYLHNELKDAYAKYRGWDDNYYEDDKLLYRAEWEAYEVIAEIREQLGYN